VDAEAHPLPQQSPRVARFLLVAKHDLHLLVEVDGFELGVAGHQEVAPVHPQVLGFAGRPVHSEFLQVVAKPCILFLKAPAAYEPALLPGYLGRDAVLLLLDVDEFGPAAPIFRCLYPIALTLTSMNSLGTTAICAPK